MRPQHRIDDPLQLGAEIEEQTVLLYRNCAGATFPPALEWCIEPFLMYSLVVTPDIDTLTQRIEHHSRQRNTLMQHVPHSG